jgi:hypothetical protein
LRWFVVLGGVDHVVVFLVSRNGVLFRFIFQFSVSPCDSFDCLLSLASDFGKVTNFKWHWDFRVCFSQMSFGFSFLCFRRKQ